MATKLSFRQKISRVINRSYGVYLRKIRGVDVGKNCQISWRALIDRAHPKGVHIGDGIRVVLEAMVIAHAYSRGGEKMWCNTYIGKHCVIGGRVIILPGVSLGDHVFVGAGSVVTKSFPSHCLIVGNPPRMIRSGIEISDRTQIVNNGELVKNI
jgi:hypothetical protein